MTEGGYGCGGARPVSRPCPRFTWPQSLRGFGVSLFERGARLGVFFPRVRGDLYIRATTPAACGGSPRAGSDAAKNIGNNNVFGKSFYYGAVVFWELRNSWVQMV